MGLEDHAAGLILLAADDSIVATDAAGARWLAHLGARRPVIAAAARGARRGMQPLRIRAHGSWLVVRGSVLGGGGDARAAVTIEPARAPELAPLIAGAHGLTRRERAVTRLVAEGLATRAIAARLHLSPWTVQDHLKSIFEKVGVRTRGELVARVFFEPQAPRLSEPPERSSRPPATPVR